MILYTKQVNFSTNEKFFNLMQYTPPDWSYHESEFFKRVNHNSYYLIYTL